MSIETFVCTCCGESVPMDQRTIFLMGRSCAHNAWSKKPFYVSHAEHEFGVTITPEAITHLSVSPALIATIPIARAAVLSCTLKTQDTTDTTKMKKNLFAIPAICGTARNVLFRITITSHFRCFMAKESATLE